MGNGIEIKRETKETAIRLGLDLDKAGGIDLRCGLPFFEHMLHAMSFHGGFGLRLEATGDIAVDPHHLVEDCGLVLGQALSEALDKRGPVQRYGHAVIPMDDALSEVTVDACRRPYLAFRAVFPQARCGDFDTCLIQEFFQALANRAQINLHAECRYGHNSHHMAESLFKALGRALGQAFAPAKDPTAVPSTKGIL